jgi:hypothetical protein
MPTHKNIFQLASLLVVLGAAILIAGCGGGSGGSSGSSSGGASGGESTTAEATSKGGAFKGPAEITKFGKPALTSELETASKVLSENLEARENADFAGQCASLTSKMQSEVVEGGSPSGSGTPAKWAKECAPKLEEDATPLKATEQIRTDTLDAPIDELRVKGSEAWALYHGNDGKDWAIPLNQKEGTWKVASVVTTELE